jgi:hypothetical protein
MNQITILQGAKGGEDGQSKKDVKREALVQ